MWDNELRNIEIKNELNLAALNSIENIINRII